MASGYQVNIVINAGSSFYQEFYLTEPDLSPKEITGSKFFASISKHPRSIDVEVSTSNKPKYNYHKFQTSVINGQSGVFALSMPAHQTKKLKEGKYVFNVVMREKNGYRSSVLDGLVFVDIAFGDDIIEESDQNHNDGGSAYDQPKILLDGGGA
jgi:hypothetical protein